MPLSCLAVQMNEACVSAGSYANADCARILGVVCGALVYLTRSRSHSKWRTAIYFCISLVGGSFLAQRAITDWPQIEPWLAGFIASALLVDLTIPTLDWCERRVVPTLNRLYRWLIARLPS
ncbi:hypothetical protein G3N59_23005 [Paraburkholderia sp. Ac-20340]|nr:hypothetical protein [Paraburkholderia sp. Ac-20340]